MTDQHNPMNKHWAFFDGMVAQRHGRTDAERVNYRGDMLPWFELGAAHEIGERVGAPTKRGAADRSESYDNLHRP
jgi:hypothetical protein